MNIRDVKKEARDCLKNRWSNAIGIALLYYFTLIGVGVILPVAGSLVIAIILIPLYVGITELYMHFSNNEKVKATDLFKNGFNKFGKSWAMFLLVFLKCLPLIILIIVVSFIGVIALNIIIGGQFEYIETLLVFIFVSILSYIVYTKYAMSTFILIKEENLSVSEILKKSKQLMKGNRKKYIMMQLSFLILYIPSIISLILGTYAIAIVLAAPLAGQMLLALIWLVILVLAAIVYYANIACVKPYINICNIKFFEKLNSNIEQ